MAQRWRQLGILSLTAVVLSLSARDVTSSPEPENSATFEIAAFGDLGYTPGEETPLANVLADISAASLAFVVHVGDLGAPANGSCTDEHWALRLSQFQALPHPLIYTPGDNDWTDCHPGPRPFTPGPDTEFEPLERLARLRTVFFPDDSSLGQRRMPLERQGQGPAFSAFRENARWTYGGVTFLTLHTVGSNNNLGALPIFWFFDEGIARGRTAANDDEWAQRTEANIAWLRAGFERAGAANSRAVMIFSQANPQWERPREENAAFSELLDALLEETLRLGKPVVLVHGDTHIFRIDKPLPAGPARGTLAIENFTRLETFGQPNHHWVQITVDLADPNVFTFRQRIVAANVGPR